MNGDVLAFWEVVDLGDDVDLGDGVVDGVCVEGSLR